VESVAIERTGEKTIAQWSDDGPHVVLADVPEQRVTVKVGQALQGEDISAPVPGDEAVLSFETAANSSAADRTTVSLAAVVTGVSYGVTRKSGTARTIELLAVSSDGSSDPVTVTPPA
jgi:hypothetical protein